MESAKNKLQLIDTSTEVSNQEKTFLLHGSNKIPIYAENVSKYSLEFRYLSEHRHQTNKPVKLLIKNNGDSVELGPCRILLDNKLNGYGGRLVFLQDVYDFECLLGKNKILKLQAPFSNLPQLLARKNAIRSSFKTYAANLTYDLNVYKNLFDEIDSQYGEEQKDVRGYIQKAVIDSEGSIFKRFLDERLDELQHIVVDFSLEEHQLRCRSIHHCLCIFRNRHRLE